MKLAAHQRLPRRFLCPHRGAVLIPVLVVTLILAGTACAFIDLIVTERTAIRAATLRAQSQEAMRSGVEVLLAWAQCKAEWRSEGLSLFDLERPRVIVESDLTAETSVVSWIAPTTGDEGQLALRTGICDESGRLNVNALPLEKQFARQSRQTLMKLDGMTVHLADAILDWIDPDDEPREFGAETSYYSSLPRPIRAANAPLQSVEELLQVRGVTSRLLFGSEPSGSIRGELESDPRRMDGLNRSDATVPWIHLLTIDSAEANVRSTGVPLVHINQENLVQLFDELEQELGQDAAQFIVAYRLAGPIDRGDEVRLKDDQTANSPDAATDREEARRKKARERAESQSGESKSTPRISDESETMRGGLNLKYQPAYRIRSLFDLVGAKVHVPIRNVDEILQSPWLDDSSKMQSVIDELSERISPESGNVIRGRVNPQCAPRSVLRGVEGMTDELAERILVARRRHPNDPRRGRRNLGWLIEEGVMDLQTLQKIAGGLTIRDGDVSRAYCVGMSGDGRHPLRAEFLIDGSKRPVRLLRERPVSDSEWTLLKRFLETSEHSFGRKQTDSPPYGTRGTW